MKEIIKDEGGLNMKEIIKDEGDWNVKERIKFAGRYMFLYIKGILKIAIWCLFATILFCVCAEKGWVIQGVYAEVSYTDFWGLWKCFFVASGSVYSLIRLVVDVFYPSICVFVTVIRSNRTPS